MDNIKSVQIYGDRASSFYFETQYKLNKLQSVLKSKKSLQNTIQKLQVHEFDEIGFLEQLRKHSTYYPSLYAISEENKNKKVYIIVNQKTVFFNLSDFFNTFEGLKKHFRFVPCLIGEESPNYLELSKAYFLEKIEKEFSLNQKKDTKIYFHMHLICEEYKFNLIGELYYKKMPNTINIFLDLVKGRYHNDKYNLITYQDKQFNIKRKQFIQLEEIDGVRLFQDENFSIIPDKPGCIALVNKGFRDSNNGQFFVTLEDLQESLLNNVCVGRFIIGMENLLNFLKTKEDTDKLNLKIVYGDEYFFYKEHYVQKNGIMVLDNSLEIDEINNNVQKKITKKNDEEYEQVQRKTNESARLAKIEEEKIRREAKLSLQKEIIEQKKSIQKSINCSQLKDEFKIKKNLQTSISNIRDLDKQQPIEIFYDQIKQTKQKYAEKLVTENEKLLKQYQELIDQYEIDISQYENQQPYKLNIRQNPPIQNKTQDNSVFNIQNVKYTPPPKQEEGQEEQQQQQTENKSQDGNQENDEQKNQQPKLVQEHQIFEVLEPFKDLMSDEEYDKFIFQSQYTRIGKNCRTINVLDKTNKQRYIIKQFNTKKSYEEEKILREKLDKIIEESANQKNDDLTSYVAQVISYNDQSQTILYEGGETTLKEFHLQMMKNQTYWFQDRQRKNLNQVINQLNKILQTFNNNKVFIAPNLRDDNIILTYNEDYIDLKLKIVDLGFSSIDEEFDYVKAQMPAFSPFDVNQNQIKDQEERILYEQAWLGKLILYLMNQAVQSFENYKNQFLKDIQYSSFDVFIEPYNNNVKELIEKQKNYYDQFHLELLNALLIDKQKDKTKKVLDQLRKDAKNILQNIYDYDELIRQQMIEQLYLPVDFYDQYQLLDNLPILSNLEFYEKIIQIIRPFIKKQENLLPDIIFHYIIALDSLNWVPKIKKFISYLEENSAKNNLQTDDKSLYTFIQLVKTRVENPDLTNSDTQAKINDLVTKYNQSFIRDFGENDYKSIKALLQSASVVQRQIGKVTNKQGTFLFFRQNAEKIKQLVKSGLKLSPYEEAQNLFLSGYGYENPTEEQNMQILKDNEEALEILKKNKLEKTQLFCDIMENINSLNFASHQDDDVNNKSQKTLLSYQFRALGMVDRNCVRNLANITIYQNKNKIKLHLTNFEINELILYQAISQVKAKFTIEELQQEELHIVKTNCNQENYVQHFRDYNNKQQELEQQDKLQLSLAVAKAARAINLIHLQAKKDFEENKQNIEARITIIRQKIKIQNQIHQNNTSNDYTEQDGELIKQQLKEFIEKNLENFNSHDTFFYLQNIFPYHIVRLEEKYLEYLLELHKLKDQLEKMKQDKKYMVEYGILNYYAAHCNLKLEQRHIMSYYLYLIEEVVGPEFTNSGLQRKKTQPPLRTLERFQVAAHIFATHNYKPEPTKYLYMNLV